MNLLIVSNSEAATFPIIYSCALNFPETVNWKILGNIKQHNKLISIFGRERFIDIPISQLNRHIQDNNVPFDFLKDIPESSIIIPTEFESLRFLTNNRHHFPNHLVCPLMEERVLDFLDNKSNQREIVSQCKVLSPKEYLYSELKNLPECLRLVIKPNLGAASDGVFISQNCQEAIAYYQSLSPENKEKQVIQEYIGGDDYFYYAICDNGKICLSGTIKPGRIKKQLGMSFALNRAFDENAQKIVSHYNYSGPISIDFRIDSISKAIYLIEINPRNGSSCYFFNIAHVNWLLELANITQKTRNCNAIYNIDANRWVCYWKIIVLYVFFKLRIYYINIYIKNIKHLFLK